MGVPRGVTPTFTFTLEDDNIDLTAVNNVYVSFANKGSCLTKTGSEIEVRAKEVDVYLSQEETLGFSETRVDIQINWTYADGKRGATEVATYSFGKQLLDRVVE